MSEDLVRDKLRLYAGEVTPARLPEFAEVAVHRRRRRMRQAMAGVSSVVAVLLVVLFAALATKSSPHGSTAGATLQSQLIGPRWTLQSVTDAGKVWQAPPSTPWSLTFSGTRYQGADGCNSLSGPVTFQTSTVTLGQGASTTVGCFGADAQRLQDLFRAFESGPAKAVVSGDTLTLTGPQIGMLTLVSTPLPSPSPRASADLEGAALEGWLTANTWLLHTVTSDGSTWNDPGSSRERRQAALVFGQHGYLINPDCNDHSGAVSYASGTLIMRAYVQTAEACAEADVVQAKSARVADALFSGVITYAHQGSSLVLSNRQASITFTAGPKPKIPLGVDLPPASVAPSAPASPPQAADLKSRLVGAKWLLESWTAGGKTSQATAGPRGPWLQFSTDGVLAEDGCNSHSAPVTYETSTLLATKSLGSTLALCSGDSLAIQAAYDDVFSHQVSVYLDQDGHGLTLIGTSGAELFLNRDTGVQLKPFAVSLIGPTWRLQLVKAPGVDWHAISGSTASLLLTASGFQESDGCTSRGGDLSFDTAGTTLTFGSDDTSGGECLYASPGPPAGTLPPDNYLDGLKGKFTAALIGGKLTLTDGALVLTLRA
jgi:heat shock protein HslJ